VTSVSVLLSVPFSVRVLRASAVRLLLPLVLITLLAGCATTPSVPREPGAAAAWLGGQPQVVVRLDAAQVKAWGQVTQPREALKAVGERTKVVWLGFELDSLDDLGRAADTVHIVLEGEFPRGAASLMLDWNSAWKKTTPPGVWTNAKLGLSVSLPEEGLVAVRRHDTAPPQRAGGVLRDLDPRLLEASAVWISFWNPGQALFGPVGAKLLPVDRLDVVLTAQEGVLEGPLVLTFPDERGARAASVVLKLLAGQIRSRLGQDLDWTVEGTRLVGRTLRVKQEDLKALAETLVADPPAEVTP